MADFFELIQRRGSDPECGRIGRDVMIFIFKFLKAKIKPVIVLIRYNRRVKDIIAVAVVVEVFDEFVYLLLDVFRYLFRHAVYPASAISMRNRNASKEAHSLFSSLLPF